jgi:long-chain-fatty-acid--CoA ligase ACSBG
MSGEERSPTSSPTTAEAVSTSSSSSSGYQSASDTRQRQEEEVAGRREKENDDFVVVDMVDGLLQETAGRAARRWSCSLPRVRFHSSEPARGVDIAMGESGLAAEEPLTVGEMMQRTVARVPHRAALRYKTGDTWNDVSYREYYYRCIAAAKSFLKLGLQPSQTVVIAGFNSLQWHVSALGAIFARGLSCGVHTDIGKEELYRMARNVHAAVAVVENHSLTCKFLMGKVRGKLPELKAVVQYTGRLVEDHQDVYDWEQFLALGGGMTVLEMERRMQQSSANQCASLVYTAGTTGDPKVVMLSHDNLTWTAKTSIQSYRAIVFGAELSVSYLPLSHIAAQMLDIYVAITAGATVHFALPDALKGSLGQTLKEIRPTMFFGVPR